MSKKLDLILQKHDLKKFKTVRQIDGLAIRSFVVVAKDSSGTKYMVKFFESKDEEALKRFKDEIAHIRFLKSSLRTKYKEWIPTIKWAFTKDENPYYIYKYVEGQPLGKFVDDFGIKWGQFTEKNFNEFIGFFDNLANLTDISKKSVGQIRNWGFRTSQKEIQYYFENVNELLPGEIYDEIKTFIDNYGHNAFYKLILSHRDLYPENILLKKSNPNAFVFLDWEYLSYVPVGFDAAFLYLLFWREEFWQSKVFSYYYGKYSKKANTKSKKTFEMSFRFCLIVLSVRFLYQLEAFGNKDKDDYQQAKNSILHVLEHALDGEIVRPRNIKFFLNLDDIKKVAKEYGIEDVKRHHIFYASKGNTVAKVDTNTGAYIFRFYSQSRSKRLIKRELKIFEILNDRRIVTYDVIPDKKGHIYHEQKLYGKIRKVAVLTYLKGRKIKKEWANERAAREVGRTLRKIHDADVIHGDFSKENVLFRKSRVTGVIDFEWGRITKSDSAKRNDLAKTIALWLIDIRSKNIDEWVFVQNILNGYFKDSTNENQTQRKRILEKAVSKIEEEREIFLTTIDKRFLSDDAKLGHRFDRAIRIVKGLNPP